MNDELDFSEIANWQRFEDLAAAYFREVGKKDKNIFDVKVQPSGMGGDGGRDILVTFRLNDSIVSFERKWVVQCKFYEKSVSKTELASINIPTLIHEYGAHGYLLICKEGVTSTVSDMLENLERNCKLGYAYEFWSGAQFKEQLILQTALLKTYFPKYNAFLEAHKRRLKKI